MIKHWVTVTYNIYQQLITGYADRFLTAQGANAGVIGLKKMYF